MTMATTRSPVLSVHRALVLAISIVLIHRLLMIVTASNVELRTVINDVFSAMLALSVTVGMFYVARHSQEDRHVQVAWSLLGTGMLLAVVGTIVFAIIDVPGQATFPSIADAFFLAFYVVFGAGLILMPGPNSAEDRVKIVLDIAIVMLAVFLVFWITLLAPILSLYTAEPLAIAVAVAYPIADGVLIFAVLRMLSGRPGSVRPDVLLLLALAGASQVSYDAIYLVQTFAGTYVSGDWVDTLSIVAFSLLIVAIAFQINPRPAKSVSRTLTSNFSSRQFAWAMYVPLVGIGVAYLLLVWAYDNVSPESFQIVTWILGGIIGLAIARQAVTFQENARLTRQLQMEVAERAAAEQAVRRSNEELELHVQERTVALTQEIAERQRAEEALRESEAKFRSVFEQSSDAIVLCNEEGCIVAWNRAAEQLTGLTSADVLGQFYWDIQFKLMPAAQAAPATYEQLRSTMREALRTGQAAWMHQLLEGEVHTPDGEHHDFQQAVFPILTAKGFMISAIIRDITERRRSDAALRESEEKYRRLVEVSPIAMWISQDGVVTYMNPAALRILGAAHLDQVVGRATLDFIHPDYHATVNERVSQMFNADQVASALEEKYVGLDGRLVDVEVTAAPFTVSGGRAIHVFFQDISARKRAEEEREVLQRLAQAFTASLTLPALVKILAVHCRRLFEYDSFRFDLYDEQTGVRTPVYGEDTPLGGQEPVDVETADDATKPQAIQAVLSGEKVLVNRKEGHIADDLTSWGFAGRRSQSMMFIPVRWQGHCIGVVYVQSYRPERYGPRDLELGQIVADQCSAALTRVQAEAEREKLIAELEAKNTELEQFTYTVSHDLKAPLITVRGFLGFVEQDARAGNFDRLEADLARIVEATDKMRRLLDELLDLSRIGRMTNPPEAVPFASIVRGAVELVQGRIEARGVQVTIEPGLPAVFGDRMRLVEVVQNLIDNACKFMGDQLEPHITIGQRGTDQDGKPIVFVRDNGLGIDPQYHEKVFGLFSKLDAKAEGTGVGLALVKRIVEVHGGRIWVESGGLGQGSTFFFTLPQSKESVAKD
jgi:PAS domain S-box-containing protein